MLAHDRMPFTLALVAVILLAGLAWANPVQAQRMVNDRLVEEVGSSDLLGGGDYVFVRFGADAAFGVLWGNATNANNVYMVALKARYLGVAQVVDEGGRVVAENVPVKYWTLYAVKLLDLFEYRDQDGDGIANYTRGYDGADFTTYTEDEPVFKRVDLNTTWTRGAIDRNSTASSRTWSFNLTATDLPYEGVNEGVVARGDNMLNLVRFTFHLRASLEEIDNVTVPQWRVTVDTARPLRPVVTNVTRQGDLTWGGTIARYGLKWDQEIEGWDYEPGGPRRLLLEFGAIVGNLIPPGVANWIDDNLVHRTNETGRARYESTAGNETIDNRTGSLSFARRLRSPTLDFEGDWTRVGRVTWVSNSTVDGVTRPVYAQVLAGHRIVARGELGGAFLGFVLLGALSYDGGDRIAHDPEVTTDVIAALVPPDGMTGVLIAVGVAVAVVLVGLLLLASRRRKRLPRKP